MIGQIHVLEIVIHLRFYNLSCPLHLRFLSEQTTHGAALIRAHALVHQARLVLAEFRLRFRPSKSTTSQPYLEKLVLRLVGHPHHRLMFLLELFSVRIIKLVFEIVVLCHFRIHYRWFVIVYLSDYNKLLLRTSV